MNISLQLFIMIAVAPRSFIEGSLLHLQAVSTAIGQTPTRSPNVLVLSPISRFDRRISKGRGYRLL